MATVSIDGPLRIWDVATGKPTVTYKVNRRRIDDVMFLPDSKVVVIPSSDEQYSNSVWLVDATPPIRHSPGISFRRRLNWACRCKRRMARQRAHIPRRPRNRISIRRTACLIDTSLVRTAW